MAIERAGQDQIPEPQAAETLLPESARRDDIGPGALESIERHLAELRSELKTAVLADVIGLIAETEAPERSELQRRAQAIQVELTLRRQEVALAEWRRKLDAAGQEADRQRQLFARLEADFERRVAGVEQKEADFQRVQADFERVSGDLVRVTGELSRVSAEFERAAEASRQAEVSLRAGLAERDAALAEARAAFEERLAGLTGSLAAATSLGEARQQRLVTLEQELARSREDLADCQLTLAERDAVLIEAERRVEELRSSRWRQLGLSFGMAKRATFEK
jgi:chromosome segregation ATPase